LARRRHPLAAGLTPEIISAALGLCVQAVTVAAGALDVVLPHQLWFGGAESRIAAGPPPIAGAAAAAQPLPTAWERSDAGGAGAAPPLPLFLDENLTNLVAFREGLGLFNHCVAHLAASQGVDVGPDEACATVYNLYRALNAAPGPPRLGNLPAELAHFTPPLSALPAPLVPPSPASSSLDETDLDHLDDLSLSEASDGEADPELDDWHMLSGQVAADNYALEAAPRAALAESSVAESWSNLLRSFHR